MTFPLPHWILLCVHFVNTKFWCKTYAWSPYFTNWWVMFYDSFRANPSVYKIMYFYLYLLGWMNAFAPPHLDLSNLKLTWLCNFSVWVSKKLVWVNARSGWLNELSNRNGWSTWEWSADQSPDTFGSFNSRILETFQNFRKFFKSL